MHRKRRARGPASNQGSGRQTVLYVSFKKEVNRCLLHIHPCVDVYNMQLSNEPAEELAEYLISTSNGAFDLCGFVSGGLDRNTLQSYM